MGEGSAKIDLTNSARYNSYTGENLDSGVLSLKAKGVFEDGWSVWGSLNGAYFVRFDGDGYSFSPGTSVFGFGKGPFSAEGGVINRPSLMYGEPIVGASLEYKKSWLVYKETVEEKTVGRGKRKRIKKIVRQVLAAQPGFDIKVYGGKELSNVWTNGTPEPVLGRYVAGATAAVGISNKFAANFGAEHIMEDDGSTYDTIFSCALTGKPADFVQLRAGGEFMLVREGFDINTSAIFRAHKKVNISATYSYSNLPPFPLFDLGEDILPRINDHRGSLAFTIKADDLTYVHFMAQAAEYLYALKFGLNHRANSEHSIDLAVADYYDRDFDINSLSAYFGWNWHITPKVNSRLYTGGSYESSSPISDDKNIVKGQAGLRVTALLIDYAALVFNVAVDKGMNSPVGVAASVALRLAAPMQSGEDVDAAIYSGFPSTGSPDRLSLAGVKRLFGEFLRGLLHRDDKHTFSHAKHAGKGEKQGALPCDFCHTHDGKFAIETNPGYDFYDMKCNKCHKPEERKPIEATFVELGREFYHSANIPVVDCKECHSMIVNLNEPTNGVGTIIDYPHGNEVWKPGMPGWSGHGDEAKAVGRETCEACHSGDVQYEGHRVISCDSCHADVGQRAFAGGAPHMMDGYPMHGMAARANPRECTTCHTDSNKCSSCHDGSDRNKSGYMHAGTGFNFYNADGMMKHGEVARRSAGMTCVPCHSSNSERAPSCSSGGCHGKKKKQEGPLTW